MPKKIKINKLLINRDVMINNKISLYQGDCLFMDNIDSKSIDLIVCDSYGVNEINGILLFHSINYGNIVIVSLKIMVLLFYLVVNLYYSSYF